VESESALGQEAGAVRKINFHRHINTSTINIINIVPVAGIVDNVDMLIVDKLKKESCTWYCSLTWQKVLLFAFPWGALSVPVKLTGTDGNSPCFPSYFG